MYEPDSMALALVTKWKSWNNGQLLQKATTQDQRYILSLELERLYSSILEECHGNRSIFIPKFEEALAEWQQNGKI